jgi:hypothetical protein
MEALLTSETSVCFNETTLRILMMGGSAHLWNVGLLQRNYLWPWWWRHWVSLKRRSASTRLHQGPDDGGSAYVWNVGLLQGNYSQNPDDGRHCVPLKHRSASTRLLIRALMMEAVRTSETSVCFNKTTHQDPDVVGSAHLWNVGLLQRDYSSGSWWWEAVRTSETSVYFDETTQLSIPEGWYVMFMLAGLRTWNSVSTQLVWIVDSNYKMLILRTEILHPRTSAGSKHQMLMCYIDHAVPARGRQLSPSQRPLSHPWDKCQEFCHMDHWWALNFWHSLEFGQRTICSVTAVLHWEYLTSLPNCIRKFA